MTESLEFTGERFVPGGEGEIAHEHWHRYAFARRFVARRRVADVACGEGYGSALLGEVAASVVGIDVDPAAVAHARTAYATRANVGYVAASATALPIAEGAVDAIVSFETVEHLAARDQPRMVAEFARVLAPGGVLVLSSPNRPEYSEARNYTNPFHLHELDRDGLAGLLSPRFPCQRWYRQRRYLGSALWFEDGGDALEAWEGDAATVARAGIPAATYFVVVAARDDAALSFHHPALSLFTDRDERAFHRIDEQAREVMRQDALVRERDAALDRQTAHVHHLEQLVAERDASLATAEGALARAADAARDAQQAAAVLENERVRLERALAAQDRIIAYRQSARWWIRLPFLRLALLWKRVRGA